MLSDLVLFRHGKAVRPHEAADDFTRGLTPRGIAQSRAQGVRLRAAGFRPETALVSTALRATQTWDACAGIWPDAAVRLSRALYLASPEVYLSEARASGAQRVVVVAHDPGLHDLARALCKGDDSEAARALRLGLPTAGIVWFTADPARKTGFALSAFWEPEEV